MFTRIISTAALVALVALPSGIVQAKYRMQITISPNPMPYNSHPTLTVQAPRGAICTAAIWYVQTRRRSVSFPHTTITSTGRIVWTWHEESKAITGIATTACTFSGIVEQAQIGFRITH